MSANKASMVAKLYKFPKPNVLTEEGKHLPESYKKFYREWKFTTPTPVHYRHKTELTWVKTENGEMKRIEDYPIPLVYPPESHKGLWGGEAVIKGFQKRDRFSQRVPHFWVPNLKKSAVYSEILDKTMKVIVTERTVDLIFQNYGFDHYILKTSACDLQSELALKLKRKMLQALYYKELYPNDAEKRETVFNKYKHYLDNYTEEDINWFGLNIYEALRKYAEMNKIVPKPLKHEYRLKLIEQLMTPKDEKGSEDEGDVEKEKVSWMKKLNPFSKS